MTRSSNSFYLKSKRIKGLQPGRADAGLSTLGTPPRQEQESLINEMNY